MCSSPNRPANSSSMESSLLFRSKIYYYQYLLFILSKYGTHQSSEAPSLDRYVRKFFLVDLYFSFLEKEDPLDKIIEPLIEKRNYEM
jgi:hypothetical protein